MSQRCGVLRFIAAGAVVIDAVSVAVTVSVAVATGTSTMVPVVSEG